VTERAVLLTPMNRPHARTSKQEQRERTEYGAEHARVQPALRRRLAIGRASAVPLVETSPNGLRQNTDHDPDSNAKESHARLLKVEAVVASEYDGEAVEEEVEQTEDEGGPKVEEERLEGSENRRGESSARKQRSERRQQRSDDEKRCSDE
jgi:hypothetical protein